MSFLMELDEDRLDQIALLLPKYEEKINSAENLFKLEGRRLEEIMRTLPHYQVTFDESYQELKSLEEWINCIKDKKIAKLWKKYNEGYSRSLSAKDIQTYISGEKEIVDLNQIIIEVSFLKNSMFSIVDAFKQLGWQMGSVTKLRIAEMQDAVL